MQTLSEPTTRWAWAEIDTGALRRNVRAFKSLIGSRQRLCCVVKADGYGHGAAACAKIMHAAGADMFAVATVLEGVALRESGVTSPILLLSEPPHSAIDTLLEHDVMPSIYTTEFAWAYGERAAALGRVGKYHMAINTGMNRIGVPYEDAVEFRQSVEFHAGLECDGTFTHFATADDPAGWDHQLQCKHFEEAIMSLREAGLDCGLVHCDNTAGSILNKDMHLDMIRAGIGLYGLQPCERTERVMPLEPVMSIRARVTNTMYPAMGEGVGYGFTYRVPRSRVEICTLPLGYADGLPRVLSNRMEVLYNGKRIQQVGNICMDQFMVAIGATSIKPVDEEAEIGDLMTVVGRDGNAQITLDELAKKCGTINYELACGFGMRLEKIYI